MHGEFIKKLILDQENTSDVFKRNVIKEYLQVLALSFIYSHPSYQNLVFYGGSCLRHCFGMERLSEDLDFVDLSGKVDQHKLTAGLSEYFKRELETEIVSKCQKFRSYLKFPILHELGLSDKSGSDFLFIKVEVYKKFDFCKHYELRVMPVFKFGRSLLIKTFDLPTLMSTKIRAVLFRKWEKTSRSGEAMCQVKGRDYFDLMWYLNKGIRPNLECLEDEISDMDDLKKRILKIVEKLDRRSVKLDLEGFIADTAFVDKMSKNVKEILTNQIKQM